jgi:hypothetical protein
MFILLLLTFVGALLAANEGGAEAGLSATGVAAGAIGLLCLVVGLPLDLLAADEILPSAAEAVLAGLIATVWGTLHGREYRQVKALQAERDLVHAEAKARSAEPRSGLAFHLVAHDVRMRAEKRAEATVRHKIPFGNAQCELRVTLRPTWPHEPTSDLEQKWIAEQISSELYLAELEKFYADPAVYEPKWNVRLTIHGPDGRYHPAGLTLEPIQVQGLQVRMQRAAERLRFLRDRSGQGYLSEPLDDETGPGITLFSDGRRAGLRLALTSPTYQLLNAEIAEADLAAVLAGLAEIETQVGEAVVTLRSILTQ